MTVRVKICCIGSMEEALLAVRFGAHAVGLVSEMPTGPGIIGEDLIGEIADAMPPGVSTFLLTCKQDVNSIVEQHRRCRTDVIQLCDRLFNGTYHDLKKALPGVKLVQVIQVSGDHSIEEAERVASGVDAILLDSGNNSGENKVLGGTGKVHDWNISRIIRDSVGVPLYLAGGLSGDNVVEAIQAVKPFAVDLCSGVRTGGMLDEGKMSCFFEQVRKAEQLIEG